MSEELWNDFLQRLEAEHGQAASGGLKSARSFSLTRLQQVSAAIAKCSDNAALKDAGCSWVVTGSLGRLEAQEASDVDLVLLTKDGDENDRQVIAADQAVREYVRTQLNVEVSKGKEFTSPTSAAQLSDVDRIGGEKDTVVLLTKRVLLLTEARSCGDGEMLAKARESILRAFSECSVTRGKHLLSLVNDVVRYYRQLCVDYKWRVDSGGREWAVRNIKFRHSKKYWFFSSMLALVSAAIRSEHEPESGDARVKEAFSLSPTERLWDALQHAGLERQLSIFGYMSRYLDDIGKPETRNALDDLKHEDRYGNEVFRRLKANSDKLHRSMVEIVSALRPPWLRHILGHFLL